MDQKAKVTSSNVPDCGWQRLPLYSRSPPPPLSPLLSLSLSFSFPLLTASPSLCVISLVQVVLFVVRQALLLSTGIPIPFPALLDGLTSGLAGDAKIPYIDKIAEVLEKEVQNCANEQIKAAFRDVSAVLEPSAGSQIVRDTSAESTSHRLNRLTSASYEALRDLLLSLEGVQNPSPDWRPRYTGMEFMGPSEADSSFSWVSEKGREEFMRRGKEALVGGGQQHRQSGK